MLNSNASGSAEGLTRTATAAAVGAAIEAGDQPARSHYEQLYHEAQTGTGRYTPNTFAWPIGSLVLHVADGKEADCLLRVVGKSKPCEYTGRPQLRMQYVYPERLPVHFGGKSGKRFVVATLDKLLDPAKFDVPARQPSHVVIAMEGAHGALAAKAQHAINAAGSYGELEKLAGITDRNAFWAPYGTDEAAARAELRRLAYRRVMAEGGAQ